MTKREVSKRAQLSRQLATLRKALSETENLRLKAGSREQAEALESASVELRDKEREIISKLGEEIAEKIESDGRSLNELAATIRKRIEKQGRMPKKMDKLSKLFLKIAEIADDIHDKAVAMNSK